MRIDPRTAPGPLLHDLPLPGPGGHEPADDRRHRPEVGHGRVQGRRGAGREGAAVPARAGRPRAACWSRATEWTSTSSTPRPPSPSAPPSTTCSARRRRAGWAASAPASTAGSPIGGHAARAQRHLLLPTLLVGAGARRLDQPGRAQLRQPAPRRPARRRLRGRDVLRAALGRAATAARPARLRGPRVPLPRLAGADRPARGARRPRGRRRTAPRPGSAARASASATARRRRC